VLLAAIGVYQFIRPSWFSDFIFNTLGIPFFQLHVLKVPLGAVVDTFRWTQANPVRVGSLFVGPFDFADFLLLPAALLLVRLTRRSGRLRDVAFLAIIGGALLASQTRANIIAAGVMALLVLVPSPQRLLANRLRILAVVLLAVVAFVPSFASSRLGGTEQSATSTQGHVNEIQFGLTVLQHYPLGLGIGTAPAVSARDPNAVVVISDNSLLQVGNELGIVMMAFFIVILVASVVALWRRTRSDPGNQLADGARLALIGLVLAGQFHHVFQTFAISWPLWAAVGLALARPRARDADYDPGGGLEARDLDRRADARS
jgi:flagellar biogenesis protein FliO